MTLFIVIAILIILSMILSYVSLKKEMKKGKHSEEVKRQLKKERVIFYAPHHHRKK